MTREDMKELNLTPIEDFITEDFGAEGTPARMEFDADADAFILGERLKEERKKADTEKCLLFCFALPIRPAVYFSTPSSRPTFTNAAMALSSCSRVWAALS